MTMQRSAPVSSRRNFLSVLSWFVIAVGVAVFSAPAMAAQTGNIEGTVTDVNGVPIADVVIEAKGDVLPQARTTRSGPNGKYRFRLLPPGNYSLDFTFPDGNSVTRTTLVLLEQTAQINVAAGGEPIEEIVTTGTAMVADVGQGALKDAINAETVEALPVGQNYRDLMKLIPGVQYSELGVRGPSAGGSGADNVYQFDGVDVSLPLFGNLSSEPSTHDIAQVSIVRGGAKAIGFNRSGGFLMNTISKSGKNEFFGELKYELESKGMRSDFKKTGNPQSFDEDRSWLTVGVGGPIVQDRLLFYASYYGPRSTRSNTENLYGPVPDFEENRDEYFGKLTFAPTDNILIDASFRTSEREEINSGVGAFTQASAADVNIGNQDIAVIEGSWIISDESSLSFRYTDWENETGQDPVTFLNFPTALGDSIDINNLDQMGLFRVPLPQSPPVDATPEELARYDYYNNVFIPPLINEYGYLDNGVPTGGGLVGSGGIINSQDFFRESFEVAFDHLVYTDNATHDLHFGIQYMEVSELLLRVSNGWGTISAIGGLEEAFESDTPVFYRAAVRQQGLISGSDSVSPPIDSVTKMYNIEINDTIEIGDWTYNIGFLISQDTLYGQGLRKNPNNLSGFELAIGERYEMHKFDWDEMIQPRVGVTWNYSDSASAFINYARYHPTASSLSRAAAWDRNFADRIMDVNFDIDGNFIDAEPQSGSGGKLWEAGVKPRSIDEVLVGWTKDVSGDLTVRAHARYRKGDHFLEDVPNDIYLHGSPPANYAREEVIPGYADMLADLGGGSIRSFVIDELDGAFTKYYEASVEADWTRDKLSLRGTYTWSHYYGNFDNDDTSSFGSDDNLFIGSSGFGDCGGCMQWNYHKGNLRGDRRHMLKVYGFYNFDWNGSLGAYMVYQSGEPWTRWEDTPWADEIAAYRAATGRGTSTSDFMRFAEPAGSRTTDAHWQLDLNYTHNFRLFDNQVLQLSADIFNVFDNQTGYFIQPRVDRAGFGEPRRWYRPRRIQLAVKYMFGAD